MYDTSFQLDEGLWIHAYIDVLYSLCHTPKSGNECFLCANYPLTSLEFRCPDSNSMRMTLYDETLCLIVIAVRWLSSGAHSSAEL